MRWNLLGGVPNHYRVVVERMDSCGVDNFSNRVVAERTVFRQRVVAERMVWWMHGELIGTPRKLVDE